MGVGHRSGTRRYARIILIAVGALSLVGCAGLGLLPYQSHVANSGFKNLSQVEAAYGGIVPGVTRASDLAAMGFDATRSPNVEVLSSLGVIERFMPRDSLKFDKLNPAIQNCINSRDHCTAYVFRPRQRTRERDGNPLLDLFGFGHTVYGPGWSAEVVLLIEDGRVSYKSMAGQPDVRATGDRPQPAGAQTGGAVHVAGAM